jgi:hypothetical protein
MGTYLAKATMSKNLREEFLSEQPGHWHIPCFSKRELIIGRPADKKTSSFKGQF